MLPACCNLLRQGKNFISERDIYRRGIYTAPNRKHLLMEPGIGIGNIHSKTNGTPEADDPGWMGLL